jgi:hypothetical protein
MNDDLKATIKKNYRIIDKSSEEYFELFWNNVEPHLKQFIDMENPYENDDIKQVEFVKGITIEYALDKIDSNDYDAFWNYFNSLLVFAYIYHEYKTNEETIIDNTDNLEEGVDKETTSPTSNIGLLFIKVIKVLGMLQKNEDVSSELEDIIDDDVKALLKKIKAFNSSNDDIKIDESNISSSDFLKNIENSKIADLAKDIAKDIDISGLNVDKPEDIAKMLDFSGDNSFISNIVTKVTSTLTDKISKGELKQEELMSEAMSMMSMLNNNGGTGGLADLMKNMGSMGGLGDMLSNPMFSQMMKMAKKGNLQTKNTGGSKSSKNGTSTRERLRKKLEERKKQQKDGDNSSA